VTEEERAVLYREQCAARATARAARFAALAGDTAAAATVTAAWSALLPQPSDAWDCPCEPEPPRPPWAGGVPGYIELPEYLKR
jgi:hypothetical protein